MLLVIDSADPDKVTARSVEFGNISLATWILAPVIYFEYRIPSEKKHNNNHVKIIKSNKFHRNELLGSL